MSFGLRSASGEVERKRRLASSESKPERKAAAEPQTEARRLCGTWRMALVTSALCARGNGRGREGDGVTGSPWSEAMSALVTARKIPVQVILGIPLLDSSDCANWTGLAF